MLKLAYAQKEAGHDTKWIGCHWYTGERIFKPPFTEIAFAGYDGNRFGEPGSTIKKFANKTDLFHVHTHLRDMTLETVQKQKVPYIWDCHDEPDVWPENSPEIRLAATPHLAGPKGIAYRSYCPKGWFAPAQPSKNHLVLTSGLSDIPGHFRYWLDKLREIRTMGVEVKVWTNTQQVKEVYAQACEFCEPLWIPDLIQEMSHARAGICGSPHPNANMLDAIPNKLFEYVAAGIPAICFGSHHRMAMLIKDHGLGVAIDDLEELDAALNDCDDLRGHVVATRHKYEMESQLEKVFTAYDKAIR